MSKLVVGPSLPESHKVDEVEGPRFRPGRIPLHSGEPLSCVAPVSHLALAPHFAIGAAVRDDPAADRGATR